MLPCVVMTQAAETGMVTLARRVHDLREAAGMTQTELAGHMTAQGQHWSRTTVAKLEAGRRASVSPDEWWALARVFNVPPVWLLADPAAETLTKIADGLEVDPWSALMWMIGKQPLDDRPSSGWENAARVVEELWRLFSFVERLRAVRREKDDDTILRSHPPGSDRDTVWVNAVHEHVSLIATTRQRLIDWGYHPPLPADVLAIAQDVGFKPAWGWVN